MWGSPTPCHKKDKTKEGKKRIEKVAKIQDVVKKFKSLNLAEYSYIYKLSGLSLYLAVLYIAKEKLDIDGLTPSEISKICKDKIRISKGTDRTTISNTLSDAGGKVDRVDNPRGKGFAYRIMREGEIFLHQAITSSEKAK